MDWIWNLARALVVVAGMVPTMVLDIGQLLQLNAHATPIATASGSIHLTAFVKHSFNCF